MIRIPTATYRLQFNSEFGFSSAREIVPYLHDLGISDIYASPIFSASKGSPHGYDVIDPNQLNPELGGAEKFESLISAVHENKMGWLQDFVPNHMAFDGKNPLLNDIFENGEMSPYYNFFDILWDHPFESIRGKLLAPFLGKFYGEALESGEISLKFGDGGLSIQYYAIQFPLRAESYAMLLTHKLDALQHRLGHDHPDLIKYLGIVYTFKNLSSAEKIEERREQIRFAKRILWELYIQSPVIREFIDENLTAFNGISGDPESFNLLDHLLSSQMFRLLFWKVATEEINYRRFFNINGLISLRIEDEKVFAHVHQLVERLMDEGKLQGLRIDHVDGLYDPLEYLQRIRQRFPDAYVVVEKILEFDEQLPSWPIQGTTGYDFIERVNSIFCDLRNGKKFARIYSGFSGLNIPYEELVFEKKRMFISRHMSGELDRIASLMKEVASRDRHGADITIYGLKRALVEMLVLFPVYRTYISSKSSDESDREVLTSVIDKAKRLYPAWIHEIGFISNFLLMKFAENISREERQNRIHAAMRFQQLTGPLMAKGFEDTILYLYNRLISLNEVGGAPERFGISLDQFHSYFRERLSLWPHALNATATHDTKRGEDVRARINVLSEIPSEWERRLKHWTRINRKLKRKVADQDVPDSNEEYALYQTLIGSFPDSGESFASYVDRIKEYIVKSVREAKVHTAWLNPDADYEQAFQEFAEAILDRSGHPAFLESFTPFQRKVAHYGIINSLGQTLIKVTAPGVPDFYQGSELWDLSLVDPDNRRPVNYLLRSEILSEIKNSEASNDLSSLLHSMMQNPQDGKLKLFLIYRALKLRNENRTIFEKGMYLPLETSGLFGQHLISYARVFEARCIITIVPRFATSIVNEGEFPLGTSVWKDTGIRLPSGFSGTWRNALTGESFQAKDAIFAGDALKTFPVALLINP